MARRLSIGILPADFAGARAKPQIFLSVEASFNPQFNSEGKGRKEGERGGREVSARAEISISSKKLEHRGLLPAGCESQDKIRKAVVERGARLLSSDGKGPSRGEGFRAMVYERCLRENTREIARPRGKEQSGGQDRSVAEIKDDRHGRIMSSYPSCCEQPSYDRSSSRVRVNGTSNELR